MKEFKVNDYIKLKLEDGRTIIYFYNHRKEEYELFNLCKYVLLRKTVYELEDFLENIESVDELVEYRRSLKRVRPEVVNIPPETKFFVHCSNMQIWAENDYDTRLIHRNLAFPLLKKLTEAGDPLAKKVFKEEITKRFSTGYQPVMIYLMKSGFINNLDENEIKNVIQTMEDKNLEITLLDTTELDLSNDNGELMKVPEIIRYCLRLKKLKIAGNKISKLPAFIINLKSLTDLNACNNLLEKIPNNIGDLISLERLNLANNHLNEIPESIGDLKNLKELCLDDNRFESLPDSIGNLKSLVRLSLYYNRLESLPDSIGALKSLKSIILHHNNLESLPNSIGNLKSLEYLNLRGNNLTVVPKSLKNLKSLKSLDLGGNKILNPPAKIGDLILSRDLFYKK